MTRIQTQSEENDSLSDAQIEEYLENHPGFFSEHLDLLENLYIPHPTGTAVSLVSKQLELIRNKNIKLQQQLNSLVLIARDNDELSKKMHQLTLALIDAQTFENAVASLDDVLQQSFQADFVALKIIQLKDTLPIANVFVKPDHSDLADFQKIMSRKRPQFGQPTASQGEFLFGDNAKAVRSCAIIPLHYSQLSGILSIGSREENRFNPTLGYLFLKQMGEITSARLNALLDAME